MLHEVFDLWPSWQTVVEHVMPSDADARDVPPVLVSEHLEQMNGADLRRLAHLLLAHAHAESMRDAVTILGELWGLSMVGRRPRFGAEAGLSSADFPERES